MKTLSTLFEYFPWSLLCGVLVAALCSLLGVYVILKRIVFIGVALSEAAACGIALAMVSGVTPFTGAAAMTLSVGLGISRSCESDRIPRDAMLGVLFAAAGAVSILLASKAGFGLEEVKALLYGDLILTRPSDLMTVALVFLPIGAGAWLFRRPILYTFLDREAAKLMGIRVTLWELLFFMALSLAAAASARVAGAMLVFAYLVVAPASALLLCRRLEKVVAWSTGIAVACTFAGLYGALVWDLPSNPLIIALLAGCFLLSFLWHRMRKTRRRAVGLLAR